MHQAKCAIHLETKPLANACRDPPISRRLVYREKECLGVPSGAPECLVRNSYPQALSWMRESALLPQSLPAPDSVGSLGRQWKSELMRIVRNHVGPHGCTCRPGLRPAVPEKGSDRTFPLG